MKPKPHNPQWLIRLWSLLKEWNQHTGANLAMDLHKAIQERNWDKCKAIHPKLDPYIRQMCPDDSEGLYFIDNWEELKPILEAIEIKTQLTLFGD